MVVKTTTVDQTFSVCACLPLEFYNEHFDIILCIFHRYNVILTKSLMGTFNCPRNYSTKRSNNFEKVQKISNQI